MRYIIMALVAVIMVGCSPGGGNGGKKLDNPTSGSIRISVDESLKPLIDAEVKAFMGIYQNASIEALYVSETEAISLLINDSVRLAIITRELTPDEKEQITKQKYPTHPAKVAREGVALIVNRSNMDTLWSMAKLKETLGTNSSNKIVFDNQSSGIVRFMRDSVLKIKEMPANSYAAGTNEGVIDYVSKDPKAIGLIGTSWISDRDDSTTNKFLSSIRVIGIENQGEHYQPYQAYIAQKQYLLTRDIIITTREGRSGLGTGFASFVAGDKGQRIILKAGLVPTTMPIRVVSVRREKL